MNALKFSSLLIAVSLLAACVLHPQTQRVRSGPASPQAEARAASQKILVTFVDRSVNRAPLNEGGGYYRRRGDYQISTWSKKISTELADRYRLRYVGGWPVTALTEYCAIYEVPDNQPVDEILERLTHDERVETAQKVHVFKALGEDYSDPYFNLQASFRTMQIKAAHRWATGKGVRIAVIDTGIDSHHPDLQGQIQQSHIG